MKRKHIATFESFGRSSWDYHNLGSNGFAQLGDSEYHEKVKAELDVLKNHLEQSNPVPEELTNIAHYGTKSFEHDFGWYQELVIFYDADTVSEWEDKYMYSDDSDGDEYGDKFDRFWDWVSQAESVNLETEELTAIIQKEFDKKPD